jgi:hypothetical protein
MSWAQRHLWVVIFPAFFVVAFLVISLLMSWIGGWAALARSFRAPSGFGGEKQTGETVQMRWLAGYNYCVTLGCDTAGLYLAMNWLYRFRHPPLFIPWDEIARLPPRAQYFGLEAVPLRLGRDLRIPLYLKRRTAERLERAARGHWPVESAE